MSVEFSGYYPPNAPIDEDCNPSGKSSCVDLDNRVLICRVLRDPNTSIDAIRLNVLKRKLATEIHRKYLPDYTQKTDFVILEGISDGSPVKVIGRCVEKINDIRSSSDIPLNEVFSNPQICKDIFTISAQKIKMIISEGLIDDVGYPNKVPGNIFGFLINGLTDTNTFFGVDSEGNYKCIIDPDSLFRPSRSEARNMVSKVRKIFFHGKRLIAFGSLLAIHGLNHRISDVSKSLRPQTLAFDPEATSKDELSLISYAHEQSNSR